MEKEEQYKSIAPHPEHFQTSYFLTCENLSLRKNVAQPSIV
jgi:hypothetical protein